MTKSLPPLLREIKHLVELCLTTKSLSTKKSYKKSIFWKKLRLERFFLPNRIAPASVKGVLQFRFHEISLLFFAFAFLILDGCNEVTGLLMELFSVTQWVWGRQIHYILPHFHGISVNLPVWSNVIWEGVLMPGGAEAVTRKSNGSSLFITHEKSPAPDSPPEK